MGNTNNSIFCKENAKCLIGYFISLVCLIVSIACIIAIPATSLYICGFLILLPSIVGFIFSIIGLGNTRKHNPSHTWLGVSGIITSSAALLICIVSIIMSAAANLSKLAVSGIAAGIDEYTIMWEDQRHRDGCFEYKYGYNKATVITYYWDGDPTHTDIDIKDEYLGGKKIVSLGANNNRGNVGYQGYVMNNVFSILPEEKYVSYGEHVSWSHDESLDYEKIVFTINIGEYVSIIDWSNETDFLAGPYEVTNSVPGYMTKENRSCIAVTQEDGSLRGYHIYIRVNVDPDNPKFYSKDGKMYRKSDDTLIDFYYSYDTPS